MDNSSHQSFSQTFKPAVPRHWLLLISGVIWTGVGLLLVGRSVSWVQTTTLLVGVSLEVIAALIAIAGYRFGFYKIVERNSARIETLPEKPCMFAFTALRGYLMIGGMVTMGILLRSSSIPKVYLILPYSAMGGTLLIGSLSFYRRFFTFRAG